MHQSSWADYSAWCGRLGFTALAGDPQQVGLYLAAIAHLAASTVRQRLATIKMVHQYTGVALDTEHYHIAAALRGLEHEQRDQKPRKAAPPLPGQLRSVLQATGPGLTGARDRAMLLIGFVAALCRSEIVALDVADVRIEDRGLLVVLGASKTNQAGADDFRAIYRAPDAAVCPKRALESWLAVRGRDAGPLFVRIRRGGTITRERLRDNGLNLILKGLCAKAGLDATLFSGHSLRAGFATTADRQGASLASIMRTTKHKKVDTLMGYLRENDAWRDNATQAVFERFDEDGTVPLTRPDNRAQAGHLDPARRSARAVLTGIVRRRGNAAGPLSVTPCRRPTSEHRSFRTAVERAK